MNELKTVSRMIEKECQRNSLVDLCEIWEVSINDFYEFLGNGENRRTQPENKPLTLEELSQMVNEWVWVESDIWDGKHYSGWGKIIQNFPIVSAKIIEENPGYITEYDISEHEARFYAHEPDES